MYIYILVKINSISPLDGGLSHSQGVMRVPTGGFWFAESNFD